MKRLYGSIVSGCLVGAGVVQADPFHYNNVIIGERAQGMGGAYCAVSDDASGVYYNPAGLAFAQSNDISGSANAFYSKKIVFKDVFVGQNFTETSNGTFAPFFGVMQKLDRFLPGLVAGFAYYTLDTELTDQNDVVKDARVSSTSTYNTLRRTINRRASSVGASGGLGYRIAPNLSLGFTLTYTNSDDLVQNYLMIDQTETDSAGTATRMIRSQNTRERTTLYGMETALGVQWSPLAKLALGLTIRKGKYASQKYEQQTDYMIVGAGEVATEKKSKNPVGSAPLQVRTGVAYFASPKLLVTSDLIYIDSVKDMDTDYSLKDLNQKSAVTNYAVGAEYYLTPSIPLRLGAFTNNDSRRKATAAQTESIDYTGASIFLAWAQPNSQISLGTVVQQGSGKGDKVGNGIQQNVDAFAYTVGFSATHSF